MIHDVDDTTEAEDIGLPTSPTRRVVKWTDGERDVYFAYARQGDVITMHLAARKDSRPALRLAVEEFCRSMFGSYRWCKTIVGLPCKASVVNLAKKCGFWVAREKEHGGKTHTLVMRAR